VSWQDMLRSSRIWKTNRRQNQDHERTDQRPAQLRVFATNCSSYMTQKANFPYSFLGRLTKLNGLFSRSGVACAQGRIRRRGLIAPLNTCGASCRIKPGLMTALCK
jgi:hypothetical protein